MIYKSIVYLIGLKMVLPTLYFKIKYKVENSKIIKNTSSKIFNY